TKAWGPGAIRATHATIARLVCSGRRTECSHCSGTYYHGSNNCPTKKDNEHNEHDKTKAPTDRRRIKTIQIGNVRRNEEEDTRTETEESRLTIDEKRKTSTDASDTKDHRPGEEDNADDPDNTETDGSCDQGCKPGYQGRFCSETCRIGKYGPGCNTTCSDQCVGQHNPCHHIDGSCYLGCEQDDQSAMCRGTRVKHRSDEGTGHKSPSISLTLFAVVVFVIVIAAAAIIGFLVSRLRMTKRHRPRSSPPEDCSARIELVQVENPSLAPQHGALSRRGSNQHYEPVELSPLNCRPNDNDFEQYATPLDMERELGEYEMPLALNIKQSGLSEHSGQDFNEKIIAAHSKQCESPTGCSSQEIQENKGTSGLYCNTDPLPSGHKRRGIKETETATPKIQI
ncbi:hypothetical protein RRG08_062771, partial [Elysia crispata]